MMERPEDVDWTKLSLSYEGGRHDRDADSKRQQATRRQFYVFVESAADCQIVRWWSQRGGRYLEHGRGVGCRFSHLARLVVILFTMVTKDGEQKINKWLVRLVTTCKLYTHSHRDINTPTWPSTQHRERCFIGHNFSESWFIGHNFSEAWLRDLIPANHDSSDIISANHDSGTYPSDPWLGRHNPSDPWLIGRNPSEPWLSRHNPSEPWLSRHNPSEPWLIGRNPNKPWLGDIIPAKHDSADDNFLVNHIPAGNILEHSQRTGFPCPMTQRTYPIGPCTDRHHPSASIIMSASNVQVGNIPANTPAN